ncbi:FHA domain-containing protein [Bradyrhizobium nanningense]|uniref:FHA domain-containing protein n=1 Tax=Bradyrhizobium nanningense TaxID=1325118 RepID=UPI001009146D|nr:FHA domain-containing protein [Bradyrhizobium nanningense]
MDSTRAQKPTLNVTIVGGGPVGLLFALTLRELMPEDAAIEIFDGRWTRSKTGEIVWRGKEDGNARRQQVVTIQSRQYARFPKNVTNALFSDSDRYSEMWPVGPDSPKHLGSPRNIRISYVEDKLLELAENTSHITLIAQNFEPDQDGVNLNGKRILVICDGISGATRSAYISRFGKEDTGVYSIDGTNALQDTVLGLRVKSKLPDSTAVILTVAQNRYLLNSLGGDGFLNMRLAPEEVREVVGFNKDRMEFSDCIQSNPCLMVRKRPQDDFICPTHNTYFKPALDAKVGASALWPRVLEGLKLFDVDTDDLTGITAFRLSMAQRPRFTAELIPPTRSSSGTYGALLGDAASAIHFWPGRGLNSGFASAQSLARTLAERWTEEGRLRDSDFMRHEAAMAMLQYRHKTRAWRAMVTTDPKGNVVPIQQVIGESYRNGTVQNYGDLFLERLVQIRDRLGDRLEDPPSDRELKKIISRLSVQTLKTLVESEPWDTATMGGEEADFELLWPSQRQAAAPPAPPPPAPAPSPVPVQQGGTRRRGFAGIAALVLMAMAAAAVWQRGLDQMLADVQTLLGGW